MKNARRGRFSFKEERKLISMIAPGATLDETAAKFRTSPEMIMQKAAELGVHLERSTSKRTQARTGKSPTNPDLQ